MGVTIGRSYDPATNAYIGADPAVGWTQFTPTLTGGNTLLSQQEGTGYNGAGTRAIYVADASANPAGSDSNPGTQAAPILTLSHAISLVRSGNPDWVLLKKNCVWQNQCFDTTNKSGKSATEPLLFSSYGTGAQPQIQGRYANSVATIGSIIGPQYGYTSDYVAITDIDFYAYLRDPSGAYTDIGNTLWGAAWCHIAPDFILIEGCKFRFFALAVDIAPVGPFDHPETWGWQMNTLIVRRNVIVDGDGYDSAVQISNAADFVFDENIFDKNYHGAQPQNANTIHNFYISGYIPDARYATNGTLAYAKSGSGNISTRDPSGSHFRSGGKIIDNLFVQDNWPIDFGSPVANGGGINPAPGPTVIAYNVTLNTVSWPSLSNLAESAPLETLNSINYPPPIPVPYVAAPDNYNGAITLDHNISAHNTSDTNMWGGIAVYSGFTNVTISNNIVDDYQSFPEQITDPNGNVRISNYTRQKGSGTWSPSAPPGLISLDSDGVPGDQRSIATYDQYKLGGPGTFDHFISLVRQQTKSTWNTALTANAVNDYIRAGYGLPQLGSGGGPPVQQYHRVALTVTAA